MTSMKNSVFQIWFDELKKNNYYSVITSIIIIFLFLFVISLLYFWRIRKLDPKKPPCGLVLLVFLYIGFIKNLVTEIMGEKFTKLTPYIATLFAYIALSNLISLIGFENPTAFLSTTVSLGIITVFGSLFFAIKYQKVAFLLRFLWKFSVKGKKGKVIIPFLLNPFEIVSIISPLMSISLRLWANIFGGNLIILMFYAIPLVFFKINPLTNPSSSPVLIFAVFAIPLHAYFDLFIGLIQALIFSMLTLSYWSNETIIGAEQEDVISEKGEVSLFNSNEFGV